MKHPGARTTQTDLNRLLMFSTLPKKGEVLDREGRVGVSPLSFFPKAKKNRSGEQGERK